MANAESALMGTIQLELTSNTGPSKGAYWIPGLRLFRNNTGSLEDSAGRWVKFGLVTGSSDLVGILAPDGLFCCLEVKVPGQQPTPIQAAFLDMVHGAGGIGVWADSVEDAYREMGRAIEERRGASAAAAGFL